MSKRRHVGLRHLFGSADSELSARIVHELAEDGLLHVDTYLEAKNAGVDLTSIKPIAGIIYELTKIKEKYDEEDTTAA